MSETSSEKTEEPTPKKLKDAREKGQVAKSKDVVSVISVLVIVTYFLFLGDFYTKHLLTLVNAPYLFLDQPFLKALPLVFESILYELFVLCVPLLALVFVMDIASNVGQFGLIFSPESIKPDLKKLNPVEGAKKIFSIKSIIELIKSLIKVTVLTLIIVYIIKDNLSELVKMPYCTVECVLPILGQLLKELVLYSTVIFLVIAFADYLFERYQHRKQLRMTHDEVKREHKETEGNPEIKSKRKQAHQELLNASSGDTVKRSSVVITNPTHLAVGIYYEKGVTPLPLVTCKGKRLMAAKIVKYAKQYNVPILQKIPLARALMVSAEVDQYIPSEFIEPIAEVIRWVNSLEHNAELPPSL